MVQTKIINLVIVKSYTKFIHDVLRFKIAIMSVMEGESLISCSWPNFLFCFWGQVFFSIRAPCLS